jgi:hypothetical protein
MISGHVILQANHLHNQADIPIGLTGFRATDFAPIERLRHANVRAIVPLMRHSGLPAPSTGNRAAILSFIQVNEAVPAGR